MSELPLTLVHAHARPSTDRRHVVVVQLTELHLARGQGASLRARGGLGGRRPSEGKGFWAAPRAIDANVPVYA